MNDLQRFIDLYRSLGIDLIIHPTDNGGFFFRLSDVDYGGGATTSEKFVYSGEGSGLTELVFDPDGKFISQTFCGL